MRGMVVGALVVALAVGTAACGESSAPLTAAAFRTQANAVCRQTQLRANRIAGGTRGGVPAHVADAVVALSNAELRRLGALRPPHDLEARFAKLRDLLRAERDYVAAVLRRGHATEAETRANIALVHRIGPTALALGLPACV